MLKNLFRGSVAGALAIALFAIGGAAGGAGVASGASAGTGNTLPAPHSPLPAGTAASAPVPYKPSPAERAAWDKLLAKGVERVVFVARHSYNSNHYYTEYINSTWLPGGNLRLLDLRAGTVQDLVPSLAGSVFGAFDISFDAKKIVFACKRSRFEGYRLFEVNADGSALRQITFPPADEDALVKRFRFPEYHHGTDDLDPCYLPDGGIAFISTRCKFGILCDAPDIFTTTNLFRIDALEDAAGTASTGTTGTASAAAAAYSAPRPLSYSAVSENAPALLPDGRILYTRWEYVDKGAVSVKCLWAMNPDGSNSSEIYGNDIAFPTTMIFGRPIPNSPHEYVFTGTPHCPQNCVGTVVRIDTTKDVRTTAPMTYITPAVDIRAEGGFHFRDPANPASKWKHDGRGRGPLFRETWPLSRTEFLVSHKPAGPVWTAPDAYHLYLLHEGGTVEPVFKQDAGLSAFRPIPLAPRKRPPALVPHPDETLAAKNLAECIVTDVYKGMENVPAGTVKYLRVLEQIPRPWGARREPAMENRTPKNAADTTAYFDEYDQQHAVISKDAALGLKVQHGIVPVEPDGSARFLVPANRAIILQALDADYRALQTERTYVNYTPGEVRSCVGCHEATSQAPAATGNTTPLAMRRPARVPAAQPDGRPARTTLSYARDVQPVWDKHCVNCHSPADTDKKNSKPPAGGLNLTGTQTRLFNTSYEQLVPERRKGRGNYNKKLLGPVIGENHPKTGNIHYLPAKSLGSHASVLAALLYPDIALADPAQRARVERLRRAHADLQLPTRLTTAEKIRVTNFLDTNAQYYGTYFGWRNRAFSARPDYRREYTFTEALAPEPPAE